MKVLKATLIIFNATFVALLILWFLESRLKHLLTDYYSICPHSSLSAGAGGYIDTYCIGNFPIEYFFAVVNRALPLLLLIVLFLDLFWLIRIFVRKDNNKR
jgi:hypothetical protein